MRETKVLLDVQGLTCERDDRYLFQPFNWQASAGELWQITGHNGAGKTSIINVLSGICGNFEGRINWHFGKALFGEKAGFIGHQLGLRGELTAIENLQWVAALHGSGTKLAQPESTKTVLTILQLLGLKGCHDVPLQHLSAGQKRRVALARLWLHDKSAWLLDEPFTAVDADGVALLEQRLEALAAAGCLVVYTSHHHINSAAKRLDIQAGKVSVR